jgi:multidrug resistance efflux pump
VGLSRLAAHVGRSPIEGVIEPEAIPIVSPAGGRISQIFVHRGERVVAGQPLLRFEAGELEARLSHVRSTLRTVPALVNAATSLFERIPPNTMTRLLRTDPEILAAEQEYADALAECEHNPSPACQARLKRAEGQRKRAYELVGELQPSRLSVLRNLHHEGLETLHWLEAQSARFEVRAPADGAIELLDLQVGSIVPPLSPIALLDVGGRFVVRAHVPERREGDAKVGRRIEVVLPGGERVAAMVDSFEDRQLRANVVNPPFAPEPGDKVQVLF